RAPVNGVSIPVLRAHASQRAPGADIIPAKITGKHRNAVASLQHADVHRHRSYRAEEAVQVVSMRVQRRRDFGGQLAHVVEKIADPPNKYSGVPQISVSAHFFGALTIWLLDEARDFAHVVV